MAQIWLTEQWGRHQTMLWTLRENNAAVLAVNHLDLTSLTGINTSGDLPDHDADVLLAPPQIKRPPQYAVVLLNDDYTPMDFVIEILQDYFGLDLDRATQVMLTVHHEGKGIAGVYPRDIAETKANQVNNYARAQGHPLLCQIEPQE